MAELFLARTVGKQGFEKLVVLKQILPKYAESQRYVNLFVDEARLAASLNHRNIVQVYDLGMDTGNYFFAMEYIHGQDVRTILHRAWRDGEKLPIKFAVQIAIQIADALHYAHEKRRPDGQLVGIVHRDVSPSNVLVSYDGAVKLVDFGVAKAATSTNKTRTGTLKGKIAYMSPEQARGLPLDRRSDIFSLGIVLWEMVTTQRLFRGENDLQTLQLIINQAPKRPTEANPECSPELERIILKALAGNVDERYQTADALLADLEAVEAAEQMGQSAAALGAYMGGLFTPEVISWQESQAAGIELAEHLTNVGELTMPVSESEFIEPLDFDELDLLEDDEPLDEDEEPSTIVPTTPTTPVASLPPIAGSFDAPTVSLRRDPTGLTPVPRKDPTGAVQVQSQRDKTPPPVRTDKTPPPVRADKTPPPMPAPPPTRAPTTTGAVQRPSPLPGQMPGPMSAQLPAQAPPGPPSGSMRPPSAAFPVAPSSQPWTVVPTQPAPAPSGSQPVPRLSARFGALGRLYDEAPLVEPDRAVVIERRGVIAALILLGIVVVLAIVAALAK